MPIENYLLPGHSAGSLLSQICGEGRDLAGYMVLNRWAWKFKNETQKNLALRQKIEAKIDGVGLFTGFRSEGIIPKRPRKSRAMREYYDSLKEQF